MAYVKEIGEDEATGVLKEIYAQSLKVSPAVPNLLKAQSLRPEHLKRSFDFASPLLFGESELTRAQRELVATTVSAINRCRY